MNIEEMLVHACEIGASDLFIVPGSAAAYKVNGDISSTDGSPRLSDQDTFDLIQDLYKTASRNQFDDILASGDDDFSFSLVSVGRFRVNIYKQRGSISAVIRIVPFGLPDINELGLPPIVQELYKKTKGLILVTGPSGSGKSTTLAAIIDQINKNRNCHILTLEDPIEFLHRHNKSLVSQREISLDTRDYVSGLKAALRQAPDVILIGEMRDLETIEIAMRAAETGHLVLSTLHTVGAANTIDRIIDVFPASQQGQIRVQLAMVLQAVVSQHLIPSKSKGRAAAFEVMIATNAVRTMIRESKLHQLDNVIFSGSDFGMQTMDSSIIKLRNDGIISKTDALFYATNKDTVERGIIG